MARSQGDSKCVFCEEESRQHMFSWCDIVKYVICVEFNRIYVLGANCKLKTIGQNKQLYVGCSDTNIWNKQLSYMPMWILLDYNRFF